MSLVSIEHHLASAFNNPNLYLDDDNVLILLAAQDLGSLASLAKKLNVEEQVLLQWLDSPRPHLPPELTQQLEEMTIGEKYIDSLTILAIGGLKALKQWQGLTNTLMSEACERSLFDVPCPLLDEDKTALCEQVLAALLQAGMSFSPDIGTNLNSMNNIDDIESNEFTSLLSKIFNAMVNLDCYYQNFFESIAETPEVEFKYYHYWDEILVDLAVYHVLDDQKRFPSIDTFKRQTELKVQGYITALKCHAYQHRLPLRAELLDLLTKEHKALYDYTEAEMMGLLPPQIHPDIYINEIIESQRLAHQVLPEICRKLKMSEDEIKALIERK